MKSIHLDWSRRSLGEQGKYEWAVNDNTNNNNNPKARDDDYGKKISNITIANYTRDLKVFFAYLYQEQLIPYQSNETRQEREARA